METMIFAYSLREYPKSDTVPAQALSNLLATILQTGDLTRTSISRKLNLSRSTIQRILDCDEIPTPHWFQKHKFLRFLENEYPQAYQTHGSLLNDYVECRKLDSELVHHWAGQKPDTHSIIFPNNSKYGEINSLSYAEKTPQAVCLRRAMKLIQKELGFKNSDMEDLLGVSKSQYLALSADVGYLPRIDWFKDHNIIESLKVQDHILFDQYGRIIQDYVQGVLPGYSRDLYMDLYPSVVSTVEAFAPFSSFAPSFEGCDSSLDKAPSLMGEKGEASLRSAAADFLMEYHNADPFSSDSFTEAFDGIEISCIKTGDKNLNLSVYQRAVIELCALNQYQPSPDGCEPERRAYKLLSSFEKLES